MLETLAIIKKVKILQKEIFFYRLGFQLVLGVLEVLDYRDHQVYLVDRAVLGLRFDLQDQLVLVVQGHRDHQGHRGCLVCLGAQRVPGLYKIIRSLMLGRLKTSLKCLYKEKNEITSISARCSWATRTSIIARATRLAWLARCSWATRTSIIARASRATGESIFARCAGTSGVTVGSRLTRGT